MALKVLHMEGQPWSDATSLNGTAMSQTHTIHLARISASMVEKCKGVVAQLHLSPRDVNDTASWAAQQCHALRVVKNGIIGNRSKKRIYLELGVASMLVGLIGEDLILVPLSLQLESAVVLGSLAYGNEDCAVMLAREGAIRRLVSCISPSATDVRMLEACSRALRFIVANVDRVHLPDADFIAFYNILNMYIHDHLNPVKMRIVEQLVSVLACVCKSHATQTQISKAGFVPVFVGLLDARYSWYPKVQEVALEALSTLVFENKGAAELLISSHPAIISHILQLVREKRELLNFFACSFLVHLYKCGVSNISLRQEFPLVVLPSLVKLFAVGGDDPATCIQTPETIFIKEKAPVIFAYLVGDSETLQKSALDANAVTYLSGLFKSTVPSPSADEGSKCIKNSTIIKRSALLAISSSCSLREECRKAYIDAGLLPLIVEAMSDPYVGVREAACKCTRSLSRSVKNLRTALMDAGIAVPLLKLLSDASISVQISATATLCNIVLDFSPLKKTVMEGGGIPTLINLVTSADPHVRLNSVWAVKNLLYQASSELKQQVLAAMTPETMHKLLIDNDIVTQEQALNVLRNLACGRFEDIQNVILWLGDLDLYDIISSKINTIFEDILLQTLYIIVNVATGTNVHKSHIMDRPVILTGILNSLSHPNALIRIAAVWCIINLTWVEDSGSMERVAFLARFGFKDCLEGMTKDTHLDVRDPVLTALNHFKVLTADLHGLQEGGVADLLRSTSSGLNAAAQPWIISAVEDEGSNMDTTISSQRMMRSHRQSGSGVEVDGNGLGDEDGDDDEGEGEEVDYFDDAEEGF